MTTELESDIRTEHPAPRRLPEVLRAAEVPRRYRIGLFAALMLVAISRAPYVLFRGRFFAEEGSLYFQHMKTGSLWYVARPVGYIYAFCNLAAWLAARVPLDQAPLVTAWMSLGIVAVLVWAALALPSELLPNAGSRVAAAILLVVGPLALPEVWLNTTNSQVYLGVLALLLLFVDVHAVGRVTFVAIAILLGIAGLSGLYAVALAPLFVFRAYRDRTRRPIVLAAIIALCAVAQLAVVQHSHASGDLAQGRGSFPGLGAIVRDVSTWHFGTLLLGNPIATHVHANAHSFLRIVGFGFLATIVAGVFAFVLANAAIPRVALLLAAAFVIEEVLVLFGSRHTAAGRYVVAPVAILLLIAVNGTAARNRVAVAVAATVCVISFVAGCATFWTSHPSTLRCVKCPPWRGQVSSWRSGSTTALVIWPYDTKLRWVVHLPRRRIVAAHQPDPVSPGLFAPK